MRKLKVLDCCTEFGSETQAFKDRGHEVVLLGIEGDVDILCDIREFHTSEHYDFMWFSPPCTEFSIAKAIPCRDRKPDLSIVEACFQIIKEAKPVYWILENPRGCLRHLIGKPTVTIYYSDYGAAYRKPTDLWGEFPWFWSENHNRNICEFEKVTFGLSKKDVAERSRVPYNLSLAVCKAVENAIIMEEVK